MHAGEASNGSDQRAHGDIFYVSNGETSTPAGIRYENARRQDEERQRPAGTRRHILRPQAARRARRRGIAMKMHAGEAKQRQGPAGTRWHILLPKRRNDHVGGKWNEKCTPVR
ncbi:MAG: hypothetical protein ACLR23_26690 [Clostridia bacterium]